MKKMLLLMFLTVSIGYAQEDAWVYFRDKPDATYYIANPLEMLSQKSLDRRARQGIMLDDKDVPINAQYIAAVTNINGVAVKAKSKWLNALHVRGSVAGIRSLAQLEFVSKVDFADNSLDAQGKPSTEKQLQNQNVTTSQKPQAGFNYGTSSSQIEMLNGHLLHEQNFTGTGMTIAVLDAGFPGVNTAQPFKRLYNNNLILGGYNFVDRSNNFYTGGTHGTMVVSTIGGYTEGQLVGTAPDAAYYLFVTEDVNSENPVEESYWVEAAEKADSLGIDVINTSLGYFEYDNPKYNYTYEDLNGENAFITRGANVAFTRGMMCVTSAGNSGAGSNPNIGVPADAPNTLTVGAVDSSRQYVSFSSIGPTFDMRVKPDVMAQGRADYVSDVSGNITTASGTSFSSPVTAGLVACLWQALPTKTNAELLQIIKKSADRYSNPDNQYGYGIPDFWKATQTALHVNDFEKEAFLLYPNPTKDIVSVSLPNGFNNVEVTIYNSLGQAVLKKAITSANQISVEHLPAGIYTYNLQADSVVKTGKLVKKI